MQWYRVFYKKYGKTPSEKTDKIIEFQAKNFVVATNKAEKKGRRKKYRVVMIAEVSTGTGLPDSP